MPRTPARAANPGAPTLAELNGTRVPYLEAVLEEAPRLHATSVARQATRDTEILGRRIPKGTNVIMVADGPGFPLATPGRRPRPAQRDGEDDRGLGRGGAGARHEGLRPAAVAYGRRAGRRGRRGVRRERGATNRIWHGGRRLAYLELRMVTTLVVWAFDLLEVGPSLADPKASYGIVHRADRCFLRLEPRVDDDPRKDEP